jgi:diacylglycerol kinase
MKNLPRPICQLCKFSISYLRKVIITATLRKMVPSLQTRIKSFSHAFSGLMFVFRTQVNVRIHLLAALLVIIFGFYFRVTAVEWSILIICMCSVIGFEMMNTAIERLADEVSVAYNKRIGIVKDIAAGAVLVVSIGAAAIGLLIFIPYLAR